EELDRLLREPADYEPTLAERSDRAFIFCPDFAPNRPEELFPGLAEECRVWLFGPDTLPDKPPKIEAETPPNSTAAPAQEPGSSETGSAAPKSAAGTEIASSVAKSAATSQAAPVGTEQTGVPLVLLGEAREGHAVKWSP